MGSSQSKRSDGGSVGRLLNLAEADYIFSHGEALEISGVSHDTLMTWFKRSQLAEGWFTYGPGRGNRRRYNIKQVILLAVTKVALEAGYRTMNDATLVAFAMTEDILRAFRLVADDVPAEARAHFRGAVMGFAARVPDRSTPRLIPTDQFGTIPDSNWRDHREWIVLLDEATIAGRILDRAVAVVRRRKAKQ
jgi:hypothetical protein